MQGKRIFITGGAGFIGSTLIGRLIENNEIVVYDSMARNALAGKPYAQHKNLRVVAGDVLDAVAVGQAMQGASIVVHCAAIAGIDTVGKSPVATMRVNVLGSANVLESAARLAACERVICFSTSEIFGTHAFMVREDMSASVGAVGEPRWTYAASKLSEEHFALAYHREQGLPAVVVRPFNVYGPGQIGEGALRNFITRAISNEPLRVYGSGTSVRAWCYVDDMVDAVLLCMQHPNAIGETFNIGNNRAVATTWTLAQRVIELTQSRSDLIQVHRDAPDIALRVPDTQKATERLGFTAQVSLDEGIRRTADWFRKHGA